MTSALLIGYVNSIYINLHKITFNTLQYRLALDCTDNTVNKHSNFLLLSACGTLYRDTGDITTGRDEACVKQPTDTLC